TIESDLSFVYELIGRLKDSVSDSDAIIGFAGGPFTLASYVVAGGVDHRRSAIRKFRAKHPDAFQTLLERFTGIVKEYLKLQANSGADAVQLFDTYAGILPPEDYQRYILPLHQEIFNGLDVPSIIFVRGMGGRLELLDRAGADAVSLDWTVDLATARNDLGATPVQGNLDPSILFASPDTVRKRTEEMIRAAGPSGYICNLGHGVSKDTPIQSVKSFVDTAKEWTWS
ncbi:MAG: uroporphyrinogen decarboxylase family protein, partial [Halobacteriaceae archaeon]